MSIQIQTGNMLDVVVEGKSIGLKQKDSDHRKYDVIWLPTPEGLRDVLSAEIERLNPEEAVVDENTALRERLAHRAIELERESREMQKWNNRANQLAIEGQDLRQQLAQVMQERDEFKRRLKEWEL